ncbi:MAG: acyl-CoA dehydrogenase [Betaproteobacteria bacterium]|nr:acyl-CoA dehydrogenase [Betaproteobacteria bacterium]
MTDNVLADSIDALLEDSCPAEVVRAIEQGGSPARLWQTLADSGFADALVPEDAGGAGLSLRDALPILSACGRVVLPVPFAQTMLVRGFLAASGVTPPPGPATFAIADAGGGEHDIVCSRVTHATTSDWVLVQSGTHCRLLPTAAARLESPGVHGSLEAGLTWGPPPADAIRIANDADWHAIGACVFAAQMAGSMSRVFDLTLRYANDRVQFGRSIGKFQAIQHQVSVMAEHVAASRMAAEIGADSTSWQPSPLAAAIAKSRTSEAVPTVTAIAHAVHGAIGITAEYDLQLHTRRLHEWRLAFGSESYWHDRIGRAVVESRDASTAGFIVDRVFASSRTDRTTTE